MSQAGLRWWVSDRGIAIALLVGAGLLFGISAWLRLERGFPWGDEPHYLIASLALSKYHTFDLSQVYANQDYRAFYPGKISPHVYPNSNGLMVPLHNYGAPILWLLPFIWWGRAGATGFMVVVSVLIVLNLYWLLRDLRIDRGYAALTAVLFAVGSTVYTYAAMLFVEPIGALLVLFAFRTVVRPQAGPWRLAFASLGLGVLPWLHGRFIVLTASLGALLAYRIFRQYGRRVWPYVCGLAPMLLLTAGLEGFNRGMYDSWSPSPGVTGDKGGVLKISPVEGLGGQLFDRDFGLIPSYPLLILAVAGVLLTMRRSFLAFHLALAITVIPYLILIGTFSYWWAGFSPPARFLTVIVPLFGYYVAVVLQRVRWIWVLAVLAAGYAYFLGLISDLQPQLRFPGREDAPTPRLAELTRLVGIDLNPYIATMHSPDRGRVMTVWAIAALGVALVVWVFGRRAPADRVPPPAVLAPSEAGGARAVT